jgi:hypothetical protein
MEGASMQYVMPEKQTPETTPMGCSGVFLFEGVLRSYDRDLVGGQAFVPGGIVGSDNKEVGRSGFGQGDRGGGVVAQISGLGVIATGKSGIQFITHGVSVGVAGCHIGVPG